ncbi:MAG: hypothetical protein R3B84_09405 [Zavarzinella sp.]
MNSESEDNKLLTTSINLVPLKKQRDGQIYTRPPEIEVVISDMSRLTKNEFVKRVKANDTVNSIPSECLLYFLRRPLFNGDDEVQGEIFTAIRQRVLKAVPVPGRHISGKSQVAEKSVDLDIRDAVLDKFQELLCKDRNEYQERLDFFECRFNAAVARLRATARRDVSTKAAHYEPLISENETNEPGKEVKAALFSVMESFDSPSNDFLYRSKIHAAISSLPLDERRVVELFLEGFPIDSKDQDTMTMVKILYCCEKTVRNRLKRAFAMLAELLKEENA